MLLPRSTCACGYQSEQDSHFVTPATRATSDRYRFVILRGRPQFEHTPHNVAPHNTVLTTQVDDPGGRADLLGISRPTLVRLLEDHEIPFRRQGRHRRVALADLIEYQQRIRSLRREMLEEMRREATEDDSYKRVNGFIKTR